jgi:hypothetical protein
MSAHEKPCLRHAVATGPVSSVEHCAACGQVHVHIGALTVRLEAEAFRAVVLNLAEAFHKMNACPTKASEVLPS